MASLFSAPKPPPLPPLPPLPKITDPAVEEAKRKARLAAQKRRGRGGKTILTSGLGDASEAPIQRKTLLGQ